VNANRAFTADELLAMPINELVWRARRHEAMTGFGGLSDYRDAVAAWYLQLMLALSLVVIAAYPSILAIDKASLTETRIIAGVAHIIFLGFLMLQGLAVPGLLWRFSEAARRPITNRDRSAVLAFVCAMHDQGKGARRELLRRHDDAKRLADEIEDGCDRIRGSHADIEPSKQALLAAVRAVENEANEAMKRLQADLLEPLMDRLGAANVLWDADRRPYPLASDRPRRPRA
jgi:hypothetical protein